MSYFVTENLTGELDDKAYLIYFRSRSLSLDTCGGVLYKIVFRVYTRLLSDLF